MKSFDNASTNVKDVRAAMNGRIGEIISAVVGDDTLQNLFEQPEHNQAYIKANAEGKPSGIIALDLGIIDRETKNALLVAQAAERMARNAERAQAVESGTLPDESWRVSAHDDVFKYVGSDRDPSDLQEAQASWQISQIWLNSRIAEMARDLSDTSYPKLAPLTDDGNNYSGAILKASAKFYAAAANTLDQKGLGDAAERLRAVSNSINPDNASEITATPHDIAESYLSIERQFTSDLEHSIGYDNVSVGPMGENSNEKLAEKLIGLTKGKCNDGSTAPASAPTGGASGGPA